MSDKKSVWKKRLGVTVGVLFALYVIVGFLGMPLLLRYVGLRKANEALAGKVTIEAIRVNPFAYSLTLRGVTVVTPGGDTVLGIERFYGNFGFWSLFGKGWRFQQVHLEGPLANLSLDKQGRINVLDLLKTEQEPDQPDEPEAKPFVLPLIFVDHFWVKDGRVDVALELPGGEFRREGKAISFELNDFSTDPQNANPYAFTASTQHGETVEVSGRLQLNPLSTSGSVAVSELQLADFDVFAGGTVAFEVASGSLSLGFDYQFSPASEPRGLFVKNGRVSLRDFALQAPGEPTPFQSLSLFEATGFGVDLLDGRVSFESIRLADAYLRVVRDKQGLLNLIRYVFPQSSQEEIVRRVQADIATAEAQFSQERDIRLGVVSDNQDIGVALSSAWHQVQQLVALNWQVSVGDLQLENNTLDLRDEFTPQPVDFTVSAITLKANDLRNYGTEPFPFSVGAAMTGGGTFSAEGSFLPEPDSASMSYRLAGFDFTPFQPYLSLFTPARLGSLRLSSDGEGGVSFPPDELPQASLTFNARLDDLRLYGPAASSDAAEQPLLTVASVTLDNARATSVPLAFHADLLRVGTPVLRVVRDAQGQINLFQLLPVPGSAPEGSATSLSSPASTSASAAVAPAASSATEVSAPKVAQGGKVGTDAPAPVSSAPAAGSLLETLPLENFSLREFRIENGSVILIDEGVRPSASFAISDASFAIGPILLKPDSVSRFEARALLGQGAQGTVSMEGELIPLNPLGSTRLKVATSGVTLGAFGGYSDQMVGRPLEQGTLDADLSYVITDSRLEGDNRVRMKQVSFGPRQPESSGPRLPLDLGMAILVDRNGVMTLEVPVYGDLRDPSFSLASVIQYAIINVFEKLVTAPFSVLGSLLGGGSEAPATAITFAPGSTEVPVPSLASLGLLADALDQRPTLALQLVPVANNPEDMVILRERLLQARLEAYAKEHGISTERTINRLYEQLLTALPSMNPQARTAIESLIASASASSAANAAGEQVAAAPVSFAVPPPVVEGSASASLQTVTTRSIVRARRGIGYLTTTETTEVLVPVAPEVVAAAHADTSATAEFSPEETVLPESASAATDPAVADSSASAVATQPAAGAAAGVVALRPADLSVADKRAILLSQTLVSRAAVLELINARMAAISAVLAADAAHPLAPERIRAGAELDPQAGSGRQATPSVYFELVPLAGATAEVPAASAAAQ